MITIQNCFPSFSSLLRLTIAAALLVTSLTFVPKAEATLIGLTPPVSGPDITTFFIPGLSTVDANTPGILSAELSNSFSFLNNSPIFTDFTFSLFYNVSGTPNSLSISDSNVSLLNGNIIQAGEIGDVNDPFNPKTYDFLVQITKLDDSLKAAGFGSMAGVIFSDAGGYFQSDTFNVPVPEPATVVLLAAGLAGLAAVRRRAR